MLYWNYEDKCVTTKKGNTSIYKGVDNDTYIESWLIDDEETKIINFAYTQTEKNMGDVERMRFFHFKEKKISPYTLRRLKSVTIPKIKYEELEKRFDDSH